MESNDKGQTQPTVQDETAKTQPAGTNANDELVDPGQRPAEHMQPFDEEASDATVDEADFDAEEQNAKESSTE